jgi:hypothetical protein
LAATIPAVVEVARNIKNAAALNRCSSDFDTPKNKNGRAS